jgi:hypothetical protein
MAVSNPWREYELTLTERTNSAKKFRRMVFTISRLYRETKMAYNSESEREKQKPLLARGTLQAAEDLEQKIVLGPGPTRLS